MIVLGIDTSFDDTAVAIVENGKKILASTLVSQIKTHDLYGGVVPEVASRKHLEAINIVIQKTFDDINMDMHSVDGIAVTNRPGLMGALIVGVTVAKTLSFCLKKPLIGVHHGEAHIYANFLSDIPMKFPQICLIISGRHTTLVYMSNVLEYEVLGSTLDDAVGEVYDKIARYLGLGLPGGPNIERLAIKGNPKAVKLPRPLLVKGNFNFSFSGLKTAVIGVALNDVRREDISASFQQSVIDVLLGKTFDVARIKETKTINLSGGVAANDAIKTAFEREGKEKGIQVIYPPNHLCTDNAAMVASLGYYRLVNGQHSDLFLEPFANATINNS